MMNKKTEAQCAGMMLTVGFHGANPPLIWRFDLERNHSFTLALQGEEGDWELGVTSPKGDFYTVAHFLAREDAEEAFAKVEKALARKHGSVMKKALGIVALLALLVIAGAVTLGILALRPSTNPAAGFKLAPQSGSPAPSSLREGAPMQADDVLKMPPQ